MGKLLTLFLLAVTLGSSVVVMSAAEREKASFTNATSASVSGYTYE